MRGGVHEGELWFIWRGCGGTSTCTRRLLCIAFQRLFQSPITRLDLCLIRRGGHFPRVFQTLHNLSDRVSWTITMLSLARKHSKKKKTYRSSLCSSLPPHSHIFHASISQILVCNKAEIKRPAGQLKYNESRREPFASGVVGLQRMWYLRIMRSGFICEWAGLPTARLPCGFVCRRCWMCLKLLHQRTIASCISACSYGHI